MTRKKQETRGPVTDEDWIQSDNQLKGHVHWTPEPERSFEVGQPVRYGHWENVEVMRSLLGGKVYLIEFDLTDRAGNKTGRDKALVPWYELFQMRRTKEAFAEKLPDMQHTNRDVAHALHLVLWNGMRLDPPYQRGLV